MNFPDAISRCLLAAWTLFLACGTSLSAEDDRLAGPAVLPAPRTHRLDDDVFDLWIFGGNRDRFREEISEQLQVAVQNLDWKYGLSAAERKKLSLAGQADTRRFFEESEILRQKYRETRGDHRKLLLVHREAVALRLDVASRLFDDRSFFAKVARSTLSADASRRLAARQQQRLRSAAERAVRPLERTAGLRPEQCEKLIAMLLEEDPPINLGEDDATVMKYRLTEIPQDQLKPLFDDAQWPQVQVVLNLFHEYRPILQGQGLIDDKTGRVRCATGAPTAAEKDRK